ncbi:MULTISPECIES: hypothetical protein [Haloferax]|uniref:Uncharacterized protein n=1 Tax=Haloferax marinum TaxID=2666143 RepID=A0A6A8G7C7_9EURY|nr:MULTISPECIES: hypothetical protein [Haloferax]KAB1198117.1 hypothetical protein Hfx1150_11530 [Haloferax sp. CBA1150]MRW97190.1 hypothetical protein [Haloferax marinum]
MTLEAVVQGEFHASPRDAKNLLERDTSTADALFVEGRSATIQLDSYTHGYVLFLLGYLTLELIYLTSDWVYGLIPGCGWDAREEAERRDLVIEDEIDAELHEVWYLAQGETRRRLYYLAVAAVAYALLNPFIGSPVFGMIPVGLSSVIIACLTPLGFSAGVVILAVGGEGIRDDIMSESILETAEDKGYEEILVLCGQGHVEGIEQELEDAGWDVERNDSTHPLTSAGIWI